MTRTHLTACFLLGFLLACLPEGGGDGTGLPPETPATGTTCPGIGLGFGPAELKSTTDPEVVRGRLEVYSSGVTFDYTTTDGSTYTAEWVYTF